MVDPPTGCRFHPRCPFATTVCREQVPELIDIGEGRAVACWGYAPPDVSDDLPVLGAQRCEVTV